MGGKGSKPKPEDVEQLPRLYPEENYTIKTRSPMPGRAFPVLKL